jgi:IclR helix-turn-helix domain
MSDRPRPAQRPTPRPQQRATPRAPQRPQPQQPTEQVRQISIVLTATQVDAVVRAASRGGGPSIAGLIAASLAAPQDAGDAGAREPRRAAGKGRGEAPAALLGDADGGDDSRLSRSLLRGFSLLAGFGADGGERGIVELASELGMSPSTVHRYALTLVELGLLERCPRTRKYRLPAVT